MRIKGFKEEKRASQRGLRCALSFRKSLSPWRTGWGGQAVGQAFPEHSSFPGLTVSQLARAKSLSQNSIEASRASVCHLQNGMTSHYGSLRRKVA